MSKWTVVALALSSLAIGGAHAAAADAQASGVRVRYEPRELTSAAGARRVLKRIGDAALESCGASSFSLSELKTVTVESRCWRDAVEEAVRSIDSPLLSAAAQAARR